MLRDRNLEVGLDPRVLMLALAIMATTLAVRRLLRDRQAAAGARDAAWTPPASSVYRRNPAALEQHDSGELIVSLPGQVEGLGLNAVAARCWALMDGTASLGTIAKLVAAENDVDPGSVLAEVRGLAVRLEKVLYALPAHAWSVIHTHGNDLFAGASDEGVVELRREPGLIIHVAEGAVDGALTSLRLKSRFRLPRRAVTAFSRHVEREAPLRDAHAAFDTGWAHSAAGRLGAAEEAFRRAAAIAPGWANPHYQLGYVHLRARRYDAALEEFTITEREAPGFYMVREYLDLARKLSEGRLSFEAFHLFERAARAEPGDPDHVIQLCRRALDLSPDFPSARLVLGRAYARKKDYESALSELRRAIHDDPDRATLCNALCARGAIFLERGMSHEAVREFEQVIQLDGSESATRTAMAHLASDTSVH